MILYGHVKRAVAGFRRQRKYARELEQEIGRLRASLDAMIKINQHEIDWNMRARQRLLDRIKDLEARQKPKKGESDQN